MGVGRTADLGGYTDKAAGEGVYPCIPKIRCTIRLSTQAAVLGRGASHAPFATPAPFLKMGTLGGIGNGAWDAPYSWHGVAFVQVVVLYLFQSVPMATNHEKTRIRNLSHQNT